MQLDHNEKFVSFEYAKITCGREINGETGLSSYCCGKSLEEILDLTYGTICQGLKIDNEESKFILYLEWDALRAAIAQYLGVEDEGIDSDRCQIISVEHNEVGIEIAEIILPPKEIPKILPCNLK